MVLVSVVTCYQLPPYQAVLQLSAVPFSKRVHCGAASTDRWHFHSSSTPLEAETIRIPCSHVQPDRHHHAECPKRLQHHSHNDTQLLMSIMLRSRMINPLFVRVTIFLGVRYITHTPTYGDYCQSFTVLPAISTM